MSDPGPVALLARNELRLTWRELKGMFGSRRRLTTLVAAFLLVALFLHLMARALVRAYRPLLADPDSMVLLVVSLAALFAFALALSQAMEGITRAFYSRDDLDLLLSSPTSPRRIFAVRIVILAAAATVLSLLLFAPFLDMLVVLVGPRWLGGYLTMAAIGAFASAIALALTMALFRLLGPKRTRTVAQVVSAAVGGVLVLGIQAGGILSYGRTEPGALFGWLTPGDLTPDSLLWWPARAFAGDALPLLAVCLLGFGALALAIAGFAGRFTAVVGTTAGTAGGQRRRAAAPFRDRSPAAVLRRKEWMLLRRDPWLLSQSLLQVLYLIPPAILLWTMYGGGGSLRPPLVIAPILVMAAGQLAAGLAWLAVSGEDAPDLVATAPLPRGLARRAKVEAVLAAVAMLFAPFVAALALLSPMSGLAALIGIAASATSATAIQIWFRARAQRRTFRRRQTASRLAAIAETLISLAWAGAAALAAAGLWFAAVPALLALAGLAMTRALAPRAPPGAAGVLP